MSTNDKTVKRSTHRNTDPIDEKITKESFGSKERSHFWLNAETNRKRREPMDEVQLIKREEPKEIELKRSKTETFKRDKVKNVAVKLMDFASKYSF